MDYDRFQGSAAVQERPSLFWALVGGW